MTGETGDGTCRMRLPDDSGPDGDRAARAEAMRLDGPPDGGDLLLRRALRRIREEATRAGLPACPFHGRLHPRDR